MKFFLLELTMDIFKVQFVVVKGYFFLEMKHFFGFNFLMETQTRRHQQLAVLPPTVKHC